MSTSLSPLERYNAFLIPRPKGRPNCYGWSGKIDVYGNAHFSWTDETGYHSGNALRWAWQHYRGPLTADQTVKNTCGWSACQRLGHWEVIERKRGLTPAERYEARIDRSGGPDACHEWQAKSRDKNGYGLFSWRENGRLITVRAHRFGWDLAFPDQLLIPDTMVLHRCDNPPCNNPRHWFLGTALDNRNDMLAKGRQYNISGESHHKAKMTDPQVAEARARYTGEWGQISALAQEYGVTPRTMGRILKGERRV